MLVRGSRLSATTTAMMMTTTASAVVAVVVVVRRAAVGMAATAAAVSVSVSAEVCQQLRHQRCSPLLTVLLTRRWMP
jgi:hypothetical protein